ncbi:hypothetical protein F5Y08DRAFT_260449 [Xylaria arbuscula]|nr:hypothetical protein F5Y08DRAFT_260449 [Xylaria arbuscula]
MAVAICPESASAWCHENTTVHGPEPSHPPPPSASNESFEAAPPPILSRCSSTSSLASLYSTCSNDSSSTTDSSSPDESFPIIGILKKPKPPRRRFNSTGSTSSNQQQQRDASPSQSHCDNDSSRLNGFQDATVKFKTFVLNGETYVNCHRTGENQENGQGPQEEDEGYYWNSDEDEDDYDDTSDCDIVFERHVTFTDPIATDLVNGAPVAPSPHSRAEWKAMRARERLEMSLERMRILLHKDTWDNKMRRMRRKTHERTYRPRTNLSVRRSMKTRFARLDPKTGEKVGGPRLLGDGRWVVEGRKKRSSQRQSKGEVCV